jgi:hypothetical protein
MFQPVTALGKYRKHVPAAALAAAGITAVRHEDCGPCTQLAIVTARMYPTVKYAISHGKACTRIVVAGAPVTFEQALASAHRG